MSHLLNHLSEARKQGRSEGIYSVCSAHPLVLEAAIDQALADGTPLLIEATCNQVNHQGGYTGMQPEDFGRAVVELAERKGFCSSRLILGGDHLGPNPWQHLRADEAMREAGRMVDAYVRAGFRKIHLDASMSCADDPKPLSNETIAARAAELCGLAENAAGEQKPVYVIGTEVPVPGGTTEDLAELAVTTREAAEETLAIHRHAFQKAGLDSVWPRVIALVVQPGVEFNHDSVIDYQPARAAHLTALLEQEQEIVYEAHSTDYQQSESYCQLVRDGFAVLKVGPALTFAMREAIDALAAIEAELLGPERSSRAMEILESVMLADSRHWARYYGDDQDAAALLRRYSYSDRVRYYWNEPRVKAAVERLLDNLGATTIPETMLSAYLPDEYRAVRAGLLKADGKELVLHHIRAVLQGYAEACRG